MEENKPIRIEGTNVFYFNLEAREQEQRWFDMREWILLQTMMFGYDIGDEALNKVAHEKFNFSYKEPSTEPKRTGHYFIADIGMLYKEGDLVYKIVGGPDNPYLPSTEPYAGEWVFNRAVSSFDF